MWNVKNKTFRTRCLKTTHESSLCELSRKLRQLSTTVMTILFLNEHYWYISLYTFFPCVRISLPKKKKKKLLNWVPGQKFGFWRAEKGQKKQKKSRASFYLGSLSVPSSLWVIFLIGSEKKGGKKKCPQLANWKSICWTSTSHVRKKKSRDLVRSNMTCVLIACFP